MDRHNAIVDPRDPDPIGTVTDQLVERANETWDYDKIVCAFRTEAEKTLASYGYPTSLERIAADKIEVTEKAALDAQDVLIRLRVLQHFVECGSAKLAAFAMIGVTAGNLRHNERDISAEIARRRHERDVRAKKRAREIAKGAWKNGPKLRMGEIAEGVREQLATEGMGEYHLKSIKKWIRDIAPAEASRPGRSRKKEQKTPL